MHLLALLMLTVLSNAESCNYTAYTVIPDDHYYPNTTCHHCHNLQYYLINATKYFTSNTQLHFLPGLHHLHTDLIIQNVHNISLIGSTANGTIPDIVIQCNRSSSTNTKIAMINIINLLVHNITVKNCGTTVTRISNIYFQRPTKVGVCLSNCYNISLYNVGVYGKDDTFSAAYILQSVNSLGISTITNLTCYGIVVEYKEQLSSVRNYINSKLLIKGLHIINIRISYFNIMSNSVVIIRMFQFHYKVEIELCNTTFSDFSNINLFNIQLYPNMFGNSIHFNQCIIENIYYIPDASDPNQSSVILLQSQGFGRVYTTTLSEHHKIEFSNCIFNRNRLYEYTLINIDGDLINIIIMVNNCIFKHNMFQVIQTNDYTRSAYDKSEKRIITFENTTFLEIRCDQYLIQLTKTALYLAGPVIFTKVDQLHNVNRSSIIYVGDVISVITFSDYIEFSNNLISAISFTSNHAFINTFVIIQEHTLVNMSNNAPVVLEVQKEFTFSLPCYFQYCSEKGNLDKEIQTNNSLNYSVVFHNDSSIKNLMTIHCTWLPFSAFNVTRPIVVNKHIIKIYPLVPTKVLCFCMNGNQNCTSTKLAIVYPGQMITSQLSLNKYYMQSTQKLHATTVIEKHQMFLPLSACKFTEATNVKHKIHGYCTPFNFTVLFSGSGHDQCELFLITSPLYIDTFYVHILPCPPGFIQSNGICTCDPILNSKVLSITTCDINHQTVLRPAGIWLSAVTSNDSHQYYFSYYCPFDYCKFNSMRLNLAASNSQCNFKRSGILCGQCLQGLSNIFGSSRCQHCSSMYLFLIIPIAIVGLIVIMVMFSLNLTVTDGELSGFIMYINIVSINSHIFLLFKDNVYFLFINSFVSLANLDLGIEICFYNGMDDYAKMWLQLAFPAYLILIATLLIIASRYSTKVQRITARRALPVLATLFLLSYTKVLRTVSSVLFYYSTITHLPSGHTELVWAVDANVPLFGLKYTALFIVCLILFIILLPFNAILCFTKTAMRLKLVNHFKPLIDAYQGPYKYKYYYWAGLQLVIRAVFFGLSALDRNINLTVGIILLAVIIVIQSRLIPFKDNYKNLHETGFLFNLLVMYALSHDHYDIAVSVMISMAALQFLLIIIHHIISNVCGGVIMHKLRTITNSMVKWITGSQNKPKQKVELMNVPPDKTYNYQELQEPLVGHDD